MSERLAVHPGLERLFGVPTGVDEVAVFPFDGTKQLELLEPRLVLDGSGPGGEALLELRAAPFGDRDGIDLHHAHGF
jgi:hypothetical protein